MRWEQLSPVEADSGPTPPLIPRAAVARTFDTPEFAGLTFYEIHARSIINRVPAESRMPFRHTVNPYRGCSHACRYCFARNTHRYLDLDSGADFDSKVVVKVNAAELLRRELRAPRWRGEHVAMGTNVDCYQRAEGRYRLMPGIISALTEAANPFSILTKGTLILRDLPLLTEAAIRTSVHTSVSVGFLDTEVWRQVEPGTPRPTARLDACARLTDAGVECGVLIAPVLPFLTDSDAQLRETVAACAEAGATSVTAITLHLRPGAREWYLAWLREAHPDLLPRYRRLYSGGSYAAASYRRRISDTVRELAERHGVRRRPHRGTPAPPVVAPPAQPRLF
ncbi:Rv2578c family radical SAM protein [Stackebrandtia albiflava]|nr:Rv2578c family radical SAM protein [Stackebrandtia albiflava]